MVFWAAFTVATILLITGYIEGEHYVEIVLASVGLYNLGNIGEHWARRRQYTPSNWNRDE